MFEMKCETPAHEISVQRYKNSLKYGWICEEFCKQLGYQADT